MLYRKLRPEDAPAFHELRALALGESPAAFGESLDEHRLTSIADTARRLAEQPASSFVCGVFDGDRLVGTAGLYREPRLRRQHRALVWGVFVDPEYRHQGIAAQIIQELIQEARQIDGLVQLTLTVSMIQSGARRLYLAAGFRSTGIEPRALKVGNVFHDEERMVFDLDTH